MSNIEKSKNLIYEAIRNLSSDFALSDARSLLSKALSEIQHVESKRARRINFIKPQATTNFVESRSASHSPIASQSPHWTPDQIKVTMSIIDKMIAEEKQKLDNMKNPPQKLSANGIING
jgi:hypothetical protein